MNIEILPSKDGLKTCKIDNLFVHSVYSPLKESERFVQAINTAFNPELIFVIEPCLSYCLEPLKKRFPKSKICVIRFLPDFKEYNLNFDYVFNFFDYSDSDKLFSYIYNQFSENLLSYSLLLTWEPAGKLFDREIINLYKSYKKQIEKCHSILRTRSFFEKRWIFNSVTISSEISNISILDKKGNCPIVVCASGPSLKEAIPAIKKANPFVIAVSSAFRPLYENGINPDIILTTDGGYWAKKHLAAPGVCINTRIALAVEGNIPKHYLKENKIIPLVYSDGIESEIYKKTELPYINALRCGTVSGTALNFAKQLTSGPVIFAGLDLSVSKGFQHTQNNNLELLNYNCDFKFLPKEKRLCSQGFSNQKDSLKIYEDWFSEQTILTENTFRVSDKPKNSLGKIKDISSEKFSQTDFSGDRPVFKDVQENNFFNRINKIEKYILQNSSTENWFLNTFTADYLNYIHSNDENLKEELYTKLEKQNKDFLERLCRPFTKK